MGMIGPGSESAQNRIRIRTGSSQDHVSVSGGSGRNTSGWIRSGLSQVQVRIGQGHGKIRNSTGLGQEQARVRIRS